MELKKIDSYVPIYWEGKENIIIRFWVYTQRGLNIINEFKYLVAGIMAGYVILKFTNPWWMLVIGLVSLPFIIILGRWQLHKVSRVSEWVGVQYGSVLGYNSYNLNVRTVELLEEIKELLNERRISHPISRPEDISARG